MLYQGNLCAMIVATERLGWPGKESSRLERAGILQKRLVYPRNSGAPTATCHLQPSAEEPALCGFPWEGLVAVPGGQEFEDIDEWMRCDDCQKVVVSLRS